AEVGLHLVGRPRRPVEQGRAIDVLGPCGAQGAHRDASPVARMDAVAAGDVHGRARVADGADVRHAVAQLGRHGARAVAEHEPEVLAAPAPAAPLARPHQQDAVEVLAVGEVAYEHRSETVKTASDSSGADTTGLTDAVASAAASAGSSTPCPPTPPRSRSPISCSARRRSSTPTARIRPSPSSSTATPT